MKLDKTVPLDQQDIPLSDLLDIDPSTLDAQELQDLIKHIQEKRTSPQRRRSDNVKAASKISGKTVDLLEDF
tara:strand:- start:365 stop:580 length:216 start_codon:yes stop_codon:yes gene_type:complete